MSKIVKSLSVALWSIICLCLSACSPQYSDFFPYHDDGTPKPHVALLPIYNETQDIVPWDVSQELTNALYAQLMKSGKLFLPTPKKLQQEMEHVTKKELTVSQNLTPFLCFQPQHFVVVLELIENKIIPYERGTIKPLYMAAVEPEDASVLCMKVRMKIVDIRGGQPKIIRQEIINSNHMFENKSIAESIVAHEDRKNYGLTAFAVAHTRLVRELAEKIERVTSNSRP